eukprot:TRINITY_DN82091_c0_g1_i1.p1 TRINITY_DN82091_c0_g1~~TRINITY_DN82091_c0_g1_i1.p1  ORF type:complete len:342 (+),score=44.67 TRINITY_DN82091_c0_g1_i1:58-1083(+)
MWKTRYIRKLVSLSLLICLTLGDEEVGKSGKTYLQGSWRRKSLRGGQSPVSAAGRLFFQNGNYACPSGAQPILDVLSCIEGADETLELLEICGSRSPEACVKITDRPELPQGCLTIEEEGLTKSLLLNPSGRGSSCDYKTECHVVCVKEPLTTTITETTSTSLTVTLTTSATPWNLTAATTRTGSTHHFETLVVTSTTSTSTFLPTTATVTFRKLPDVNPADPADGKNPVTRTSTTGFVTSPPLVIAPPAISTSSSPATSLTSTSTTFSSSSSFLATTPSAGGPVEGCSQECSNFGFVPDDCMCYKTGDWFQWVCTSRSGEVLPMPYFCDKSCVSCHAYGG